MPELVAETSHVFNVTNHIALLAPHFIMQYPMGFNRKGNKTSVKVNTKTSNLEKYENRSD